MAASDFRARRGWHLFWLSVLHMMCHGLLTLILPLYVAIQHDFGLSGVEPATALSTWQAMVFAIATLGVGWLCDRTPGRRIAGWGLVVQGLGLIGLAAAPTLGWARFWVVVSGIGAAGYHPVAARQIIGLYPEAVGWAMGMVGIGSAIGFYAGPRYAGWYAERAGWSEPVWNAAAWRAPMLHAGLVAIVVAVLFMVLTIEPVLSVRPRANGGSERRDKALLVGALGLLGILLIPRDFSAVGFDALHSLYLQHGPFAVGLGGVGSLLGYKGLLSLVTNPIMSWLSDRGHRLRWWAGVLLASAVFGAAVPWLPPALAKLALVLNGMFFLANYPIFESALVERVPPHVRGRAYALILTIVGVFSATAPKVIGARVDAFGATGAVAAGDFRRLYLGLAACMVAALLAVPLLGQVQRRGDRLAG